MTLITHALGGVASIALLDTVVTSFSPDKFTFILGGVVATLADIDYSRSFIGRIFYPISRTIEANSGHRTITHSFLFAAVFSALLGSLLSIYFQESHLRWFIIVFIPYCSHFILDWFTKEGCASYWPAKVWCVLPAKRSFRISTGKSGEFFFFIGLIALFTVLFTPTRNGLTVWFRSSFTQSKTDELERFQIKREQISHGYSKEELTKLYSTGVITKTEYNKFIYELKQLDINEKITRKMYGLPQNKGE